MDALSSQYHGNSDSVFSYENTAKHLDPLNGKDLSKNSRTSVEELNGRLSSPGNRFQSTRSPRYEAFVMTGDKMLRLNPKISPNYARLKQSQLPRHTEILETSASSCAANRSMEGPFSDLEAIGTPIYSKLRSHRETVSTAVKSNGTKASCKFLEGHASIDKLLTSCNGLVSVSHRENLPVNQENGICTLSTSHQNVDGNNALAQPLNHKLSGGGSSIINIDSSLPQTAVARTAEDRVASPAGFPSERTSLFHQLPGDHVDNFVHDKATQENESANDDIVDEANNEDLRTYVYDFSNPNRPGHVLTQRSISCAKDDRSNAVDDREAIKLIARRLYEFDGFTKHDVGVELCKSNDLNAILATEYMKLFNFAGLKIDAALRMLLQSVCLTGETAEKEYVLLFFSRRYYECNPSLFRSEKTSCVALNLLSSGEVHTLVFALLLLNADLYHSGLSKHISSREFVDNILKTGHNYPMDLLKSLYQSVRLIPIECSSDSNAQSLNSRLSTRTELVDARFLDDEFSFKKSFYHSAHNAIRIHHALAVKATDYCKKQNIFKLQTATLAEYYFQTSDPNELQEWINTINFVAACFSSPTLPSAANWRSSTFQRPLLASAPSRLSLREQLEMHEARISDTHKQLSQHRAELPARCSKPRVLQAYAEKEIFLIYELERYSVYAKILRPKVEEFSHEFSTRLSARNNYCTNGSEEQSEVDTKRILGTFPATGQSTDSDPERTYNNYKTTLVKGGGYETTF